MNRTDLAYRRTAAADASKLGLLIALYDTLAGNLRRAADAERNNNLEKRCQEASHAILVIGYLEDWTHRGEDGQLARQLITFYSSMRRKIVEAEIARSAEILEKQMALILELREHWQSIDSGTAQQEPAVLPPNQMQSSSASVPEYAHNSGGWSA